MTETIAKVVRKTYLRALPGTCPLAGLEPVPWQGWEELISQSFLPDKMKAAYCDLLRKRISRL